MGVHIHEQQDILTKFGRGVRNITSDRIFGAFSKALQISLRQDPSEIKECKH
jgi:hypothetical protein